VDYCDGRWLAADDLQKYMRDLVAGQTGYIYVSPKIANINFRDRVQFTGRYDADENILYIDDVKVTTPWKE
jgi:hypothetical protein